MGMVAAGLALAVGLGLLVLAFGQRRRADAPGGWPTAFGVIRPGTGAAMPGGSVPREVNVEYDYEVDGRAYHGHRVWLTPALLAPADERALMFSYFPGSVVLVRYAPGDPAVSVLRTHARHAGLAAGALGLIVLAAGALLAAASVLPL